MYLATDDDPNPDLSDANSLSDLGSLGDKTPQNENSPVIQAALAAMDTAVSNASSVGASSKGRCAKPTIAELAASSSI